MKWWRAEGDNFFEAKVQYYTPVEGLGNQIKNSY